LTLFARLRNFATALCFLRADSASAILEDNRDHAQRHRDWFACSITTGPG